MDDHERAVEQLFRDHLGGIAREPDLVVRYQQLTMEQERYDGLVSRIKAARGEALAGLKATGMAEQQIADAVGLGTRQRVQQLINPAAKSRGKKPDA